MSLEEKKITDYSFKSYGITIEPNGNIIGPKRPEKYSQTPIFSFKEASEDLLANEEISFLIRHFEQPFSVVEHQKVILSIANKITKIITGNNFYEYTNIIIMTKDDWDKFKMRKKHGPKVTGNYHGLSFGGLIIIEDTGGNNIFPLLFHEIGHNFYDTSGDIYLDELRAMYFQILSTKMLEKVLKKNGVTLVYADDYYQGVDMPSEEHRLAYRDARHLFTSQIYYEHMKGSSRFEQLQEDLLEKVKQDQKSF